MTSFQETGFTGEDALDQEANPGAKAPDVVGTNLQVLGVDEGRT